LAEVRVAWEACREIIMAMYKPGEKPPRAATEFDGDFNDFQ
jgi:hypothetical protein